MHMKYGGILQAYTVLAKKLFVFKNHLTLLQRTYHSLRLRKSFLQRSYFKPYFNKFFKKIKELIFKLTNCDIEVLRELCMRKQIGSTTAMGK